MNNNHGYYVLINSIDDILRSMDHLLNVTMVSQLLRSDDVTVTLQWPREAGAVYHVNVSPEVSHTEHTSMRHNVFIFAINLFLTTFNTICIHFCFGIADLLEGSLHPVQQHCLQCSRASTTLYIHHLYPVHSQRK